MNKKNIIIVSVILLVFLLIFATCIYNTTSNYYSTKSDFQFPKVIENKILASLNKTKEKSKSFLLNSLLKRGKWIEINPLKDNNGWNKLETNQTIWNVDNHNGITVSVYKPNEIEGNSFGELTSDDGFFLNLNTLEWGGALYFYPNGNRSNKYKVIDGYVWNVYKNNNEIFALATYPTKTPRNGKILKLQKSFLGIWEAKIVTEIGDIPYCFSFSDQGIMYLVTNSKLLKISDNKIKEVVIDNAFWEELTPESVIYNNGYIYIGMRSGVAKINLESKRILFFTPKSSSAKKS